MFQTKLLWQNDEQWAADPLGFGPPTIKEWGCLMTSLTMVVNGFGYAETPRTFNEKMRAGGGFTGAMVKPAEVPAVFPGIFFQSYDECEKDAAPIDRIDAALASGMPVIVQVDWSPDPGAQSHWVLAYSREGDDYLILDPYRYKGDAPDKPLKLLSRYHYSGNTLAQAITGAVFLTGAAGAKPGTPPAPPPPKAKVPVPAQKFTLYAAEADLAVRADPAVSGYLIKRLPKDTALLALEAKEAAASKVGQYNQWMQIQEPGGEQGYVAAWYVATTKGAPPAAPGAPTAPSAPAAAPTLAASKSDLIVTPTADQTALRDQPAISGGLIKRLPFTAKLKVLDPAGEAARKLGVEGQWIKVRDITGQEGYIAAWLATAVDNPAIGPKTPPPPGASAGTPAAANALIVRTTVEEVALRRTPAVAADNLIKRLPLRAELWVVEPESAKPAAKIGAQNQWLKVKDLEGVEGYVAAWYVAKG